ncbi:conserved hypothetical protein [Ixodes scapularis]|uniref:Methyltransferase domain-containing protein n=1 Tax=Ixodes scapularis TaxID=6945 RepID=B7PRC7_IXOSC|nr:conserved hypothetical protein [Ixodes scapularis]|eukprot:XP_002399434.1 conserved hypothetical protein [Ixodes scapularis]
MSHFFKTTAHAAIYAKFRPVAPSALIDRIVKFVTEKQCHNEDDGVAQASPQLAVDVGCGPGTSSGVLAPHFQRVHAYDVSEAQIEEAKANNRIANLTYGYAFWNSSRELYMGCLEKHWTKQREVIDNMYRDLRLPFDDIVRDESFEDRKVQSVADYLNYACTWSAYQAHLKENPEEAKGLIARLTSA